MEKEGYDVTYISNTDTHADLPTLLRGRAFLSIGHDEYWTPQMFDNVAQARDEGVNLLFLCGNSADGTVYLEPSTAGEPNRTTGRLPQRHFDNEQELMGTSSHGVGYCSFVNTNPDHWVYEGTGMKHNDSIPNLVGWEYHGTPIGQLTQIEVLARSKVPVNRFTSDHPEDHVSTIYSAPKGNYVFNAGTCFWSLALATPPGARNPVCNLGQDGNRVVDFTQPDARVIRITQNLFNRVLHPDTP
jgi:hypothetical protein